MGTTNCHLCRELDTPPPGKQASGGGAYEWYGARRNVVNERMAFQGGRSPM